MTRISLAWQLQQAQELHLQQASPREERLRSRGGAKISDLGKTSIKTLKAEMWANKRKSHGAYSGVRLRVYTCTHTHTQSQSSLPRHKGLLKPFVVPQGSN